MLQVLGLVLAGLFCVVLLLLWISAQVHVSYQQEQLKVWLQFGVVRLRLWPQKNRQISKKKKQRQKGAISSEKAAETHATNNTPPTKPTEKQNQAKPKRPTSGKIDQLWALLQSSQKALRTIRAHCIADHIAIVIEVGGEDAHQMALTTAHLQIITSNALAWLAELITVRVQKIHISTDFLQSNTKYDILGTIRIRPIWALKAAIELWITYIKYPNKGKRKGAHYERKRATN